MQILFKRSQFKQSSGMFGSKVTFSTNIRSQYTEEERALINKYELGGMVIYDSKASQKYLEQAQKAGGFFKTIGYVALSKMQLTITLASLQKGHQIQNEDLGELLECEDAITDACKNIKTWLKAAESFTGVEQVIDLDEQLAK